MDEFFKEQSQRIKLYFGIDTEEDLYEKNTSTSMLNPIAIDAIVSDLSFSKVTWNMPGIVTESAKEIYIEKKNKNLVEQSQKIEVEGVMYEGWRISGKMQMKTEGDYIRIFIYRKQV